MSQDAADVRERLVNGPPLLLDGAVGSELDRRGVDTSLPLWSARAVIQAPSVLLEVHREYAAAGADVLTANTFRTQKRTLSKANVHEQSAELSAVAVHIARAAASTFPTPPLVAGSMAPLEDCYRPDLVPDAAELDREHGEMAQALAAAGVDLLLLETMNTGREAVAAAKAAVATGLPVLASLVCDAKGRMLSDENPGRVAQSLADVGVDGVLINCAPAPDLLHALRRVVEAVDLPTGGYGNVGHADPVVGWVNTDSVDPKAYGRHAATWLDAGARIVGGCCGTGPAHIRALRILINGRSGRFARPSTG
jgi:S-methylmethionine-dependent homocysteine/selenocysteine methylase